MDSEHRHELKTNELAESLAHLPELIKKNVNMIIGVILIIVGLITWPMFNKMNKKKEMAEQSEITQTIQRLEKDVYKVLQVPAEDAQAKTEALNTLLINADALLDRASGIEKPDLAALAYIKAAQAIRTELHLRPEVDADRLETQIQKAKDAYQKAFETADTATCKAMAQFGLGLCSEELGQTAQATEIYQQIIDEESYKPTVFPTLAQKRIDGVEDNVETFNFAKVPVIVEEPALETAEPPIVVIPQEAAEVAIEPTVKETTATEAATVEPEQAVEETTEPQAEKQ